MPVALGAAEAARTYAAELAPHLPLSLVHLGLGDDGHTASWPPGDRSPLTSPELVAPVETFNGFERVTLTPRPVNHADYRVWHLTGEGKERVVRDLITKRRTDLPMHRVERRDSTVLTDLRW